MTDQDYFCFCSRAPEVGESHSPACRWRNREETTVFKSGDRVQVLDPALAQLRKIMREATGEEPAPNHHGTVDRVEGNSVLITFDDGGAAPYPVTEVRPLYV